MMALPWAAWRWLNKSQNNLKASHPNYIEMQNIEGIGGRVARNNDF